MLDDDDIEVGLCLNLYLLLYADATIIMDESESELQAAVECCTSLYSVEAGNYYSKNKRDDFF